MPRDMFSIDWRYEFAALGPFIDGKGGVVRITYNGDNCAPHEFRKILKLKYENKPDNMDWRSIRIDREWHSTRLLAEILYEFDRKISDGAGKKATKPEAPLGLSILSDNVFQGDTEITIENLAVNSDQSFTLPGERDQRVQDICQRLRAFLAAGGHMMVVLNHFLVEEQGNFWNHLWHERLERLVELGLFFVQMVDRSEVDRRYHDMAPFPNVELDLPEGLDEPRQDDAYDDLIDILSNEFEDMTLEAASTAASALLISNQGNVKELHNNLFSLIMRLGKSRG